VNFNADGRVRLLDGIETLQALAQLVSAVTNRGILGRAEILAAPENFQANLVFRQLLGASSDLHLANVSNEGLKLRRARERSAMQDGL
jgi:hypothetical protein